MAKKKFHVYAAALAPLRKIGNPEIERTENCNVENCSADSIVVLYGTQGRPGASVDVMLFLCAHHLVSFIAADPKVNVLVLEAIINRLKDHRL